MANRQLKAELTKGPYAEEALVQPTPWLERGGPARPALFLETRNNSLVLNWTGGEPQQTHVWVLQTRKAGRWSTEILPGNVRSVSLRNARPERIALSCVDRYENTSTPVVLELRESRR